MKKQILLISLVTVCISIFFSVPAFAECKIGKTEVTIVNPAGKVIEICVPDVALSGIQNGGDNSGATIIPAICPCFTQEHIEKELEVLNITCANMTIHPSLEGKNEAQIGTDKIGVGFQVEYDTGTLPPYKPVYYILEGVDDFCGLGPMILPKNWCRSDITGGKALPISVEEAQACVVILEATFDWSVKEQ